MIPKLNIGDVIAVFSPSSPATVTAKARYSRGKKYLEDRGYTVKEGKLTGKRDFYRSGSIMERADELNELIHDNSVKCIMSAIGGNNSNSLLPYLDYEALIKTPKIIIGYSDVTALLLGIYTKTGITTFYGPAMVATFGEFPPYVDETFGYFENLLSGNINLPYTFPTPEFWTDEYINWQTQDKSKKPVKNKLITVHGGKATGRIIGGNLNTMQGFFGTQYMPEIKAGDILFIEDSLKDASDIERSFSLLKLAGIFDRIGGLILGKHECFDDMGTGRKPYEILCEVIGDIKFPFIAEFDSCHTHPMLTVPIGANVTLDADSQSIILLDY